MQLCDILSRAFFSLFLAAVSALPQSSGAGVQSATRQLVKERFFSPPAVSRLLGVLELNGIEVAIDTPGALVGRMVLTGAARGGKSCRVLHEALERTDGARQVLGASASPEGEPPSGDSGMAPMSVPPVRGVALFSLVSLMNHSCEPCAVVDYPHGNFTAEVRATRDIHPGSPITIAYDSVVGGYSARRRALLRYGFVCQCSACLREEAGPGADSDVTARVSRTAGSGPATAGSGPATGSDVTGSGPATGSSGGM